MKYELLCACLWQQNSLAYASGFYCGSCWLALGSASRLISFNYLYALTARWIHWWMLNRYSSVLLNIIYKLPRSLRQFIHEISTSRLSGSELCRCFSSTRYNMNTNELLIFADACKAFDSDWSEPRGVRDKPKDSNWKRTNTRWKKSSKMWMFLVLKTYGPVQAELVPSSPSRLYSNYVPDAMICSSEIRDDSASHSRRTVSSSIHQQRKQCRFVVTNQRR